MATVLIVDDSRTSRKILGDILKNMGLDIIGEAANGEEGFVKYKELRPDIVTMDITMPVMSGLESLLLIKHENPDARVLMVTAAGQRNNLMKAMKAGAEDFITKPLEESEIRRAVGAMLEKMNIE